MQEKYICYAYDTIKNKLFWEDGTGMTVRYNTKGNNGVRINWNYVDHLVYIE